MLAGGTALGSFVSEMYLLADDVKARCEGLKEDVAHLVDTDGVRRVVKGDVWERSKASAAFRSSIVDLI